ncbi:hypothetical protein CPB83DRAFT_900407 [Crepidotus variabilis]|uniref:Uncharacterized protein n=1 Tax=Crepidotus variabilis TaxID=179855 RepID=A0A9P6JI10_9AGAR|nr:hypothetical protein CPB83DRAFT_900407 [Crepidotus variabilis]
MQLHGLHPDPLPFSSVESSTESDPASETPSSAGSYSSYGTSDTPPRVQLRLITQRGNGTINNGPALRGSGKTFWHPPMMPQNHSDSETFWHPPVVLPNNAHHVVGVRSSTSPPVAHTSINSNINSATTASTPSSSSSLHTNDSSPMDYLHVPPPSSLHVPPPSNQPATTYSLQYARYPFNPVPSMAPLSFSNTAGPSNIQYWQPPVQSTGSARLSLS